MVIKAYISRLSGNMQMKDRQNKVTTLLESKNIEFEEIDISDQNIPEAKKFMQANAKSKTAGQPPLPPQIFNEDTYCGDYEDFEQAIEQEVVYEFLNLAAPKKQSDATVELNISENGNTYSNGTTSPRKAFIMHAKSGE